MPAPNRSQWFRGWRLAAIPLLILAALGAAAWWLWLPNWRPALREGERYGVDVSRHQAEIDWDRVAADGIDLAYLKATEGSDLSDERFDENWAEAGAAGLERGAYHFFTLCTAGEDQALNFLTVAAPEPGALAPAVDLELAGNCSERPPADVVERELEAFLDPVEDAWGRRVVLYVSGDFAARYPVPERPARPLWVRRFLVRPSQHEWVVWQVHGYARVDGIDGPVDLDVMLDKASPSTQKDPSPAIESP